ncbi:zeta toxin family protein [Micromonospora andamanensis]|uniref:zeta toxin family protein n=1 Tax=Micromonospora andamanensis TaxID=1287068 RepID=UPI001EF2C630|nr:zeta toxin family protein [Micromonospora andamanensis]
MYQLSEEELRSIFEEQIRPGYTGTSRDNPVVVFIAGQPGAGKTTVESQVLRHLGREDAVAVDGDELFLYHPDYDGLAAENDQTVRSLLTSAADDWWMMLAEHIREQRFDVVISAPLAGADWAAARFADFRHAGYRLEYVFVAVHEARSLLAVLDRYQQERDASGVGRFVRPEIHDKAYAAVLGTVDRLEAERLVDAVYVLRRGGEVVYHNSLDDAGNWREPAGLRRAIEQERSRPWTDEERDHFHRRAQATAERISEHLRPALDEAARRAVAHLGLGDRGPASTTAARAFPSSTMAALSETPASSASRSSATATSSMRSASGDRSASR